MKRNLKIALPALALTTLFSVACQFKNSPDTPGVDTAFIARLQEKQVPHSRYVISLPQNYALKENEGPDFSVYYFQPIDTVAEPDFTGGFYLGNYPSESAPNDSCVHAPLQAKIMGALKEWAVFDCQGGFSIHTLALTNSKDGWDAYVHAFGHGVDDEALIKIVSIFSTLKKPD